MTRIEELETALQSLYSQYVVDLHGEGVCDCDTHVETCAPCLARAALAPRVAPPAPYTFALEQDDPEEDARAAALRP